MSNCEMPECGRNDLKLFHAVCAGKTDEAVTLLKSKEHGNIGRSGEEEAFRRAIASGPAEMAVALIAADPKFAVESVVVWSHAAHRNEPQIIEALLGNSGAKPDRELVQFAMDTATNIPESRAVTDIMENWLVSSAQGGQGTAPLAREHHSGRNRRVVNQAFAYA